MTLFHGFGGASRAVASALSVLLWGIIWAHAHAAQPEMETVSGVSFRCAPSPIEVVDATYPNAGWSFNRELVANEFAVYAAASYDAYEPRIDGKSRAFRFDDAHPDLRGSAAFDTTGWRRAEPRHSYRNGLSYDVYYRETAEALVVLVSYRGTDGWIDADLLANLSWITQWVNPWDQYRQARSEFDDVVKRAAEAAKEKPIAFVVTGHSLGGGLAQYVAHTHPCTAAVVFNSSPVTNTLLTRGKNKDPRVIRIYVIGDVFESVTEKIVNSPSEAVYRFERRLFDAKSTSDPEFIYQHNMEAIAAVMARMAIACSTRSDCEIRDKAKVSRTLYCARYWGYRWKQQPALKERSFDKICQ